MGNLQELNNNIRNLRESLKEYDKISAKELNTIISDSTHAKEMIFLLDRIETDRSLTQEILSDLIDFSYEFNTHLLFRLDKNIYFKEIENSEVKRIEEIEFGYLDIFSSPSRTIKFISKEVLTIENLKALIILAIVVGITFGVEKSNLINSLINSNIIAKTKEEK